MTMRSKPAAALLALLLAIPVGAGAAAAQDNEQLQGRLRRAAQRLQQGDALGALLDLEAVLQQDDKMWEAYYYRGRAQMQLGDDIGANASFQEATSLNPGDPQLHFLAASAAYAMADFETAWEQSIRAMQAGYDRKAFGPMFKGMRRYSRQPADLDARVKAPRVMVQIAADDAGQPADGAGPDPPEALTTRSASAQTADTRELLLAVRRALSAAPRVALVNQPGRARYLLELLPGQQQARLRASGSDEDLATWPIQLRRIPEMTAEQLAAQVDGWAARQR